MNFEFDWEEVFNGIKLGVQKEITDELVGEIYDNGIRQLKENIFGYREERDIVEDIKKTIVDKISDKLYNEVFKDKYEQIKAKVDESVNVAIKKIQNNIGNITSNAENKIINACIDKLFYQYEDRVKKQVQTHGVELFEKLLNGSNDTKTLSNISSDKYATIDKGEYDMLKSRDRRLTALENGGVDNWEWYGDALASLDKEDK